MSSYGKNSITKRDYLSISFFVVYANTVPGKKSFVLQSSNNKRDYTYITLDIFIFKKMCFHVQDKLCFMENKGICNENHSTNIQI